MSKSSSLWVWDDDGSHNKNEEHTERADMGDKMSTVQVNSVYLKVYWDFGIFPSSVKTVNRGGKGEIRKKG